MNVLSAFRPLNSHGSSASWASSLTLKSSTFLTMSFCTPSKNSSISGQSHSWYLAFSSPMTYPTEFIAISASRSLIASWALSSSSFIPLNISTALICSLSFLASISFSFSSPKFLYSSSLIGLPSIRGMLTNPVALLLNSKPCSLAVLFSSSISCEVFSWKSCTTLALRLL